MRRAGLMIALVATAGLVLSACGGGDDEPTTTTSSSTSSSSSSTTATTGGSAAATTTTAPAVPPCQSAQLSAQVSQPDAGAGQRNASITFTNNSNTPCTMIGYIGLQLLDGNDGNIPTNVVRTPGNSTLVTLNQGGQAYTTIQWGVIASGNEPDNGPCQPNPSQIEITSPNATASLVQPWGTGPVCAQGTFNTVPVQPGAAPTP